MRQSLTVANGSKAENEDIICEQALDSCGGKQNLSSRHVHE